MTVTDTDFGTSSDHMNNFINYIKTEMKDTDIYKIEPPKIDPSEYRLDDAIHYLPSITAAAYDIILIIGAVGSISSIASILWLAYDKYIASKSSSGGLYLSIGEGKNKIDLHIGKDFKDKDIFIKNFTQEISKVRESPYTKKDYKETILMIKSSKNWKKK